MQTKRIDRRSFLEVGVVSVAGLLTATCARGELTSSDVDVSVPQLLSVLGADAVNDIGRTYRAAVVDESSAPRLRAAVAASHTSTGLLGWTQQSITDQVLKDFAEGRTVVVNGWVLSITEARQCALYSILHG
jgi:hypothetical protein